MFPHTIPFSHSLLQYSPLMNLSQCPQCPQVPPGCRCPGQCCGDTGRGGQHIILLITNEPDKHHTIPEVALIRKYSRSRSKHVKRILRCVKENGCVHKFIKTPFLFVSFIFTVIRTKNYHCSLAQFH